MRPATPGPSGAESDDERRRRRRALIRAYHPDVGGDTAEFARLLQRLDHEQHPSATAPEVRFVRRRHRWRSVVGSFPLLRRTSRRPRRTV